MFSKISSFLQKTRVMFELPAQIHEIRDLMLLDQTRQLQHSHPNPLNKSGAKCFSQTDEDGITLEILRRINGLDCGVYAEFGAGNGNENNTLILAALGWKGFWVGGEALSVKIQQENNAKFCYLREWITADNIVDIARTGLHAIQAHANQLDVVSLDLDGNDYYFAEKLLQSGIQPKLFIAEYNAKFPPPVKFKIPYDADHRWKGDDYFGASLACFCDLFQEHGYRLVCCNSHSGANAFFIQHTYAACFPDVPTALSDLYVGPRYHNYRHHGHRASPKTIESIFQSMC